MTSGFFSTTQVTKWEDLKVDDPLIRILLTQWKGCENIVNYTDSIETQIWTFSQPFHSVNGLLIISQGCLQYFLGATDPPHGGIITSFNWQFRFVNDGDPNTPPILDVQSKYLNLSYALYLAPVSCGFH